MRIVPTPLGRCPDAMIRAPRGPLIVNPERTAPIRLSLIVPTFNESGNLEELLKKLLKLTLQMLSILLVGVLPIGQEFAVQLPEALLEAVQYFTMVRDTRYQLLVMTIFMNPAEG